jgi:protein-disulfide isomerase
VTAQPANRPAAAPASAPVAEIVDMLIDIAGQPVKGEPTAKVTVVEFTDYECPFCSRHFRQTWPKLEQDFVKTGKARFVLRDLPIEAIHPLAFKAAEAAYCAGRQGKFWEMHGHLFSNQKALARKDLSGHAQMLGLDVAAFDKCVDSEAGAAKIRKDIADSRTAGARGTPIFYIGITDPNSNQVRATRIIRGAHGYATFKETIEGLLSSSN